MQKRKWTRIMVQIGKWERLQMTKLLAKKMVAWVGQRGSRATIKFRRPHGPSVWLERNGEISRIQANNTTINLQSYILIGHWVISCPWQDCQEVWDTVQGWGGEIHHSSIRLWLIKSPLPEKSSGMLKDSNRRVLTLFFLGHSLAKQWTPWLLALPSKSWCHWYRCHRHASHTQHGVWRVHC